MASPFPSSAPAATTTSARACHLSAPREPHGPALTAFAVGVRRAVQQGHRVLVVDDSACAQWPPGQVAVLERLRRLVERCGCEWRSSTLGVVR